MYHVKLRLKKILSISHLTTVIPSPFVTTMYYDGACPLCSREVSHYMSLSRKNESKIGRKTLDFVDISLGDTGYLGSVFGVDAEMAMRRLHVIDAKGRLHTDSRAFAALWLELPYWRWLGYFATSVPLFFPVADILYARFLQWRSSPLWPFLSPRSSSNLKTGITDIESRKSEIPGIGASCRVNSLGQKNKGDLCE
jgi:predicted DCC family thiol-disulfide oxidoreductase YuxK